MSMKRTKQRTSGGGREQDASDAPMGRPKPPEKTWAERMDGKEDGAFVRYALADRYGKDQLLEHTKFGRGVVVESDAHRVEVLFEAGVKKLGHGQA
ncbi:MAG: hypothetical protein KC657_19715 [Myxococcales bacterium]|nr:hypothetical protein [Myxococcales bacterium]